MKEDAERSLREWLLGYFVSPIGDGAIGDAEFLALTTDELARLRNRAAVQSAGRQARGSPESRTGVESRIFRAGAVVSPHVSAANRDSRIAAAAPMDVAGLPMR